MTGVPLPDRATKIAELFARPGHRKKSPAARYCGRLGLFAFLADSAGALICTLRIVMSPLQCNRTMGLLRFSVWA